MSSLNEQIRAKLEEIDSNVFYGIPTNIKEDVMWDYLVFNREIRRPGKNLTSKTYYFRVAIVRENEIPEGLDDKVIAKVREIPGVKEIGDCDYTYVEKKNTNSAVEVMLIPFAKEEKNIG